MWWGSTRLMIRKGEISVCGKMDGHERRYSEYSSTKQSSPKAWHRKVRTQQLDSFFFFFFGSVVYMFSVKSKDFVGKHAKSWVRTQSMSIRTTSTWRAHALRKRTRHQAFMPRSDRRRYKFFILAIRSQCRLQFRFLFFLAVVSCVQPMRKQRPRCWCAHLFILRCLRDDIITLLHHFLTIFLSSHSLAPR